MPLLFANCFGKRGGSTKLVPIVAEVQHLGASNGNFLIKPFEDQLVKAGSSKSICKLENALQKAHQSGLLEKSQIYKVEKQRLQDWKAAVARLIVFANSFDVDCLSKALDDFRSYDLEDECGHHKRGCTILQLLQARNKLQNALGREETALIENALRLCSNALKDIEEIEETGNKNSHAVHLQSDIKEAEDVLKKLKQEKLAFERDPQFPKKELEKAVAQRDVVNIRGAIDRWRRLNLQEDDPAFVSALKVLEQLTELTRTKAIQQLEKGLQSRDVDRIKRNISVAKESGVPSAIVNVFERSVLEALEKHYLSALGIVDALQSNIYELIPDIVSKYNAYSETFVNENGSRKTDPEIKYPPDDSNQQNDSLTSLNRSAYNGVLENAISQAQAIRNEAQSVLSAGQLVVRSFFNRNMAFESMKQNEQSLIELVNELADKYGEGNLDGMACGVDSNRLHRSFQKDRPNRSVVLRSVINGAADHLEKLSHSIESVHVSLKAFENVLRQTRDKIVTWKKHNNQVPDSHRSYYKVSLNDFTGVRATEAVSSIARRLIAVAKAENVLTLFDGSPNTPRDQAEVQNSIAHIKQALGELKLNTCKYVDRNFIDLCYNRPQINKEYSLDNDNSHNIKLLLNSFARLFLVKDILAIKKAAEIRLVELQLVCADETAKINSARYALQQAVSSQSEGQLVKALKDSAIGGLATTDKSFTEAEKELDKIRVNKRLCRDSLRIAIGRKDLEELKKAVFQAETMLLPPTDTVLAAAKRELNILQLVKDRQEAIVQKLTAVANSNDISDVRFTVALAKVCNVSSWNSTLIKCKKIVENHHSEVEESEKPIKRLVGNFRASIEHNKILGTKTSDPDNGFKKHEMGSKAELDKLTSYINDKTEKLKKGDLPAMSFINLCAVVEFIQKEALNVSEVVITAAAQAIPAITEQNEKVTDLKTKLEIAIAEKSFTELAFAIASAEASPDLLKLGVNHRTEEMYELAAQAKEEFAVLKMKNTSEDEEMVKSHILQARHQLKKAMLGDIRGRPLREAVETFRIVCSTAATKDDEKQLKLINSEYTPTNTVGITRTHDKPRRNLRRNKKISRRLDRSFVHANKLYQKDNKLKKGVENEKQILYFRNGKPPKIKSLQKQQKTSTSEKSFRKKLQSAKNSRAQLKMINNSPLTTQNETDAEKIKSTSLKQRPFSAVDKSVTLVENIPSRQVAETKLAWLESENKNTTLLRKAEKSLKKKQKEEKRAEEIKEHEEFLNSVRNALISNLQASIESGDRTDLWQAVHEFTRHFGDGGLDEDRSLLEEAQIALSSATYKQYRENLTTAISERNLNKLEHVLYQIENDTHECLSAAEADEKSKFLDDINKAQRLVVHLTEVGKSRDAVLTMTRSVVSEMNTYPSPPDVVKNVMAATYLLLGETETTVKNWATVHALIGRLGRSSLTRRVLRCSPSSVSLSVCQLAVSYISDLTFDRVQEINPGASTFFAWATCMINEVYQQHGKEFPTSQNNKLHLQEKDQERQITPSLVKSRTKSDEIWQKLAQSSHLKSNNRNHGTNEHTQTIKKKERAKTAKV